MMNIQNDIIESVLPDGIVIRKNRYGYALFSTKSFKAGDIIYNGCMMLVEEDKVNESYTLIVKNIQGTCTTQYVLNKYTHFVQINGKRQMYGFDSFMNHSCNPTTICHNKSDVLYDVVAFRDISVGDEITCDYALFDYECNGHEISVCMCGESNCRGSMKGFVNLPRQIQLDLLPYVDDVIYENFVRDHNLIDSGEIVCPECCKIEFDKEKKYWKLSAEGNFQKGDTIYENESIIFERNSEFQRALYKLKGRYCIAQPDLYIVRANYREFLGFDSFMNHSCNPNTEIIYTDRTHYKMIAVKNILPGEELTCDYEYLDNNSDQFACKYVITSVFECDCGSSKCRKVINS